MSNFKKNPKFLRAVAILDTTDNLIAECKILYCIEFGNSIAFRRPDLNCWPLVQSIFRRAQSMVLFGRELLKEIPNLNSFSERDNYFARLPIVAGLLSAAAKAEVAKAYVIYWASSPGYARYSVLAEQAKSFSDSTLREKWSVSAPLALLLPHQPLCTEALSHINSVLKCGDAAFASALCLHTHMELLPSKDRFVHQAAVPYPFLSKKVLTPYEYPRVKESFIARYETQEKILAIHLEDVIDDAKENSWLRIDNHTNITPAYSLIAGSKLVVEPALEAVSA